MTRRWWPTCAAWGFSLSSAATRRVTPIDAIKVKGPDCSGALHLPNPPQGCPHAGLARARGFETTLIRSGARETSPLIEVAYKRWASVSSLRFVTTAGTAGMIVHASWQSGQSYREHRSDRAYPTPSKAPCQVTTCRLRAAGLVGPYLGKIRCDTSAARYSRDRLYNSPLIRPESAPGRLSHTDGPAVRSAQRHGESVA